MEVATAQTRIATLEEALAALAIAREKVAELTKERDHLRASHERLRLELDLLKRRLFVAKAERVDTQQLEMEFAAKLAELNRMSGIILPLREENGQGGPSRKKRPTGRRALNELALPEEPIEVKDELFEKLVAEAKAKRIGFETSYKLAYQRGGYRRLRIDRVKYQAVGADGESQVETAPMPPECFPRSMASPSVLAHVLTEKGCDGLSLNTIEDRAGRDGVPIDRGTMSRWFEDAGATAGATVIAAARKEAFETAFCIATDATGVNVQPEKDPSGKRQACRKGHYFVLIADKDHVFFEYTAKETSAFVLEMLKGYSGYVQADAKSVYDVLFREPDKPPGEKADNRLEVGCWSHCRRGFWEATCAKSEVAREGLARIGWIFTLDEVWQKDDPDTKKRLRNQHLRPHIEEFFAWAEAEYEKVEGERGLLRSALGYAVRQKDALMRVLEDGRLVLENNRSERELRRIAVGRKRWLFVGSDHHAESTGHILSLIASARLHRLDPEAYLRDLFRVLAHWPRDRYLELAPKYWARTRARLDPKELAAEIGPLTVPLPLAGVPEEQTAAD